MDHIDTWKLYIPYPVHTGSVVCLIVSAANSDSPLNFLRLLFAATTGAIGMVANAAKRLVHVARLRNVNSPPMQMNVRSSSTGARSSIAASTAPTSPPVEEPNSMTYQRTDDPERAKVEKWQQQLSLVDSQIHDSLEVGGQLKGPNKMEGFTSRQLMQSVRTVVHDYRLLVSHLVRQYQQQQQSTSNHNRQSRITGVMLAQQIPASRNPILRSIEKIQIAYFESYTNRFYALHRLLRSETTQAKNKSTKVGFDKRSFTTINREIQRWTAEAIKNTRYGRSTKSGKIKTDLPAKARLDREGRFQLQKLAVRKNLQLLRDLWVEVGQALETYRFIPNKSKKPKPVFRTVACQWEPVTGFTNRGQLHRRFGILQSRDRVLAAMMETTVSPIMESQADPHSFAWRRGRGPFLGSSYVANLLRHCYQLHPRIMRIDVDNAFDNVSHDALMQSCPLAAKYQPLLRDFLTSKRYGERRLRDKSTHWNCTHNGVLYDEPLGRKLVNCALDGLEDFVLPPSSSDVNVVRYGTSILVFGAAKREIFEQIYQRLLVFLEGRGLRPLTTTMAAETLPIFHFRRGTTFDFLGFRYLFTDFEKRNGRFCRVYWTHGQTIVKPPDFQVLIAPVSYKLCKAMVESTLTRQFATASVESTILRYNRAFEKVASYFLVSTATWQQLDTLYYRGFMRMKKLLRRKFGSTPKLATYIRTKFYGRGKSGDSGDLRIQSEDGRVRMSRPLDFLRLRDSAVKGATFAAKAPTEEFLGSSVYLLRSEESTRKDENSLGTSPSTPAWIDEAFRPAMWLNQGPRYREG